MGIIETEIEEAIKESGVQTRKPSREEAESIWLGMAAKYTETNARSGFLWENFTDSFSVCSIGSWTLIQSYLQNRPCCFLINESGRITAYYFDDGGSVTSMYEETGQNIEFYVTDDDLSFLLCFNHHEYLIACGSAKEWLIDFSADNDKNG